MSLYFWLGREAPETRKLVRMECIGGPTYPNPPYAYRCWWEEDDGTITVEDDQ